MNKFKISKSILLTSACFSLALVVAGPVLAASTAEEEAGAAVDEGSGKLNDIVVTAERRTQNLQDVAISATVLTAADLAERGVRDIRDIQQIAPSVVISNSSRSVFINIRGVGIAQSAPNSVPGVAFYLDGQFIPHEQLIGASLYDIGSIEVLRGPQGTLTGQNSTGGAIYMRTPAPNFGEFSGMVKQTVGSYASYKTELAVNIPLGDSVAVRVSAVHDERDSFTRNIGSSLSQPGDYNLNGVRANLAFESGRFFLNLRGEYWKSTSGGLVFKNRNDVISANPYVIEQSGQTFFNQRSARAQIDMRYDVTDGIQVKSLTTWLDGYTKEQNDLAQNNAVPNGTGFFTAPPPPFSTGVVNLFTGFETFTTEVDILSTGNGPVQWVAGGFYMKDDVPGSSFIDNFNTTIVAPNLHLFDFLTANRSKSLFANVNWRVNDHWELQVGARHSWDKQRFPINTFLGMTPTAGPLAPLLASTLNRSSKFQAWTGKIGVNYHVDDSTMVYLTASKGYKAGGLQLLGGAPFRPEKNIVEEFGIKTELLDKHLRLNADVFHSAYKNIQILSTLGGAPINQNAAPAEIWGGEIELTGQFDGLGFNIGGSVLNAKFDKAQCLNNVYKPGGSPTLCTGPQAGNDFVAKGSRMPFSPKLTFNAGVQYEFAVSPDVSVTPRLQWSHISKQNTTPFQRVENLLDRRDVVDARLGIKVRDRYRVDLFMNNLTDQTFAAAQTQQTLLGSGGIIYGPRRQYGGSLSVEF